MIAGFWRRAILDSAFGTIFRPGYRKRYLWSDLFAGLTVAIVALPLAMALGIASGASPDKGLVTAIVAGFIISVMGGSRVQIGGPTGAFVVVIFDVIQRHGYDGLLTATLLAGVILIAAGYARLGQVIKFIPLPVVTGFTAGIAVIIASSQVKDFFGLPVAHVPAEFLAKWSAYLAAAGNFSVPALAVGTGSLAIILVLKRIAPRAPGYLAAVAAAAAAVAFLHLPVETIGARFPHIAPGLPAPSLPSITPAMIREVLPSSFTIAFLAGIEALLSAVVADGMTGFRHNPDKELTGQGLANIASSLFGGLPATGAIARTATNIRAGGRTPAAGAAHALFLCAFIFAGVPLMKLVPMPALAAILLIVSWGMSEMDRFVHLMRLSMTDRIVLLLTFGLTVLVDLSVAIAVGVTLSSVLFMMQMAKSVEIGTGPHLPESEEEDAAQRISLPDGVEVFRINGPFFFGVAREFLDALHRIGRPPKVFILRMRLVPYLDTSGARALDDFVQRCRATGTQVIFSGLTGQPEALLARTGISGAAPGVYFTPGYREALELAGELAGRHGETGPAHGSPGDA